MNIFFWVAISIGLTFSLLMGGCSEIQQRKRKPECKKLFEQVKTDWFRDKINPLYRIRKETQVNLVTEILSTQDCFIGLESKDVEKLFGKPDTTYRGRMVYYLVEPCLNQKGTEAAGCHYMQCVFNKEKNLAAIRFTTTTFKD
jgi:hypothetical protein